MRMAAVISVLLLLGVTAFQVALAAGAPWGQASWGGRNVGVLPTRLRIASAVAALIIYPAIIVLILGSASVIAPGRVPAAGATTMWGLTAFFAVGAVANLASPSRAERYWSPVVLALGICCAVIALGL